MKQHPSDGSGTGDARMADPRNAITVRVEMYMFVVDNEIWSEKEKGFNDDDDNGHTKLIKQVSYEKHRYPKIIATAVV